MKLHTCEQVSKYHPDKYADQIADAVLTAYLKKDKDAKVACEVLVKDDIVILSGEITSEADVDVEAVAYRVSRKLGYPLNQIVNLIGKQSKEIGNAVKTGDDLCAGDQGIMYGLALRETESRLPYGFELANRIIKIIESDVETNYQSLFKGDAKVQLTVDLDENPGILSVKKILISVCHKEVADSLTVTPHILEEEIRRLLFDHGLNLQKYGIELIVNPAGLWTFGGPHADTGISGRKIVCDQYGTYFFVGGGSFSGKDPSKVDRSAAYMLRHLAVKKLDEFPEIDRIELQVAYAIGQAEPVSFYVRTNCSKLDEKVIKSIDPQSLKPANIIKSLDLLNVDYEKLAEGSHFYGVDW